MQYSLLGQRAQGGLVPNKGPDGFGGLRFTHPHTPTTWLGSVAQLCPTLCNPMNRSMPGLPAHHQLPELTQIHVHWVDDAIQPFHPLSSSSPPALDLSQHQGLFKWVSSSHQVTKVSEFQLQHQFFQWTPRTDLLYDGLVGSPCSSRDSEESSPTPQFKSINSSALSFLYSLTLTSISFTTCKCGRMNSHNMQVQALLLIWDNLTSTSNLCLPSVRS